MGDSKFLGSTLREGKAILGPEISQLLCTLKESKRKIVYLRVGFFSGAKWADPTGVYIVGSIYVRVVCLRVGKLYPPLVFGYRISDYLVFGPDTGYRIRIDFRVED